MTGKQLKKGGRPKLIDGKRTKKVDARFTEDEYQLVLQLEQTLGVSKTELVRRGLLNNAPAIILNAKTMISELDSIGAELGRSGNNINQLARYANILQKANRLSPVVIERFNRLFEDHLRLREVLEVSLRNIIRRIGR
jgi:hypothetical protein